jgi:hypothetical protein
MKLILRFINKIIRILFKVFAKILSYLLIFTQNLEGWFIQRHATQSVQEFSNKLMHKVCIYAAFQKSFTPILERQLRELYQQGFFIVYVSNLPISQDFQKELESLVHVIITRPNYGRDFAAYKTGYEYALSKDFFGAEQLLFTNDTIIFPLGVTQTFWQELIDLSADVVGPFISQSPSLHLQSFFILVKNSLFRDEVFATFWNSYKNPNARMSVIRQGELGFSKYLTHQGISFEGLVNLKRVKAMSKDGNNILKSYQKHKRFNTWEIFIENAFKYANPSHAFSLIALKSLQVPMLKKDLLSRGSIQKDELFSVLTEMHFDEEIQQEIFEELSIKKPPSEKNMLTKILEQSGAK